MFGAYLSEAIDNKISVDYSGAVYSGRVPWQRLSMQLKNKDTADEVNKSENKFEKTFDYMKMLRRISFRCIRAGKYDSWLCFKSKRLQ